MRLEPIGRTGNIMEMVTRVVRLKFHESPERTDYITVTDRPSNYFITFYSSVLGWSRVPPHES